jgi:hypothetical protein
MYANHTKEIGTHLSYVRRLDLATANLQYANSSTTRTSRLNWLIILLVEWDLAVRQRESPLDAELVTDRRKRKNCSLSQHNILAIRMTMRNPQKSSHLQLKQYATIFHIPVVKFSDHGFRILMVLFVHHQKSAPDPPYLSLTAPEQNGQKKKRWSLRGSNSRPWRCWQKLLAPRSNQLS